MNQCIGSNDKYSLSPFFLITILFAFTSILAFAQSEPVKPVFRESVSPNGRFKLTLSAGEIDIHSEDNDQIISSDTGSFASETGQLGKIAWNANSMFFLVSTRAGAHNQYLSQHLYQLEEIGFSSHDAWSFQENTLIQRLGTFAFADPETAKDERWAVASVSFLGPDLGADLYPAGRNSHPFEFSSDHFYRVGVIASDRGLKVMSVTREPGELSKEPAKIVWMAK